MLRYIFILLFLVYSNGLFAQDVFYSDSIKIDLNRNDFELFALEEYNYLFSFQDRKPSIRIYDSKLKWKKDVDLDFLEGTILDYYFIPKQEHIYSIWILKNKQNFNLKVAILTKEGKLESTQEYRLNHLENTDWRNSVVFKNINQNKEFFYFSLSNQRTNTLFLHRVHLEKHYLDQFKIPLEDGELRNMEENIIVNNKGLLWYGLTKTNKWNPVPKEHHFIQWENKASDIEIFKKIDSRDYLGAQTVYYDEELNDFVLIKIKSSKENNLPEYISIEYFKEENATLDNTIQIQNHILESISYKYKKYDLYDFIIKDVYKTKNKGFYIGLELETIVQKTYTSPSMIGFAVNTFQTRRSQQYIYGEYIAIQNSDDAYYSWQKILNKSQISENDYGVFSSFYSLNTGEQNLLFFNDLNPNKNTIQLAVFRKSGELIYGKVPQSKVRDNYIFIPSKSLKIHDRAVLLPVVYSKNFIGIVKLSF